jgi:cell fate (sporulation/competence/biofilm development) regulator YlbF (YheA/YmcA/DUF963 family)
MMISKAKKWLGAVGALGCVVAALAFWREGASAAPEVVATPASPPSLMEQARRAVEEKTAEMSADEFKATLAATGSGDVERLRAALEEEKAAHRGALSEFRNVHSRFAKLMLEGRSKDDPEIVALQQQMSGLESELMEISRRANERAQELAVAYRDVALAQVAKLPSHGEE